jgi:hypothetical protein
MEGGRGCAGWVEAGKGCGGVGDIKEGWRVECPTLSFPPVCMTIGPRIHIAANYASRNVQYKSINVAIQVLISA